MASQSQAGGKTEDIIHLLERDHALVTGLFEEYREEGPSRELCDRILDELETHSLVEEEIFYPACQRTLGEEGRALVEASIEDHEELDALVDELRDLPEDSEELADGMDELVEMVEEHVETEEDELFPLCRNRFEASELESLGVELSRRKGELAVGAPRRVA